MIAKLEHEACAETVQPYSNMKRDHVMEFVVRAANECEKHYIDELCHTSFMAAKTQCIHGDEFSRSPSNRLTVAELQ